MKEKKNKNRKQKEGFHSTNQNHSNESRIEKKIWEESPHLKDNLNAEDKLKMREYYKGRRSKPKNKVEKTKKNQFEDLYY